VAIVTGAGSGNGLAIAAAYAREGAAVAIGEYSAQRGESAARSIQSFGEALFVQTDVRRWEDIDRLVGETVQRVGHLDVMVNNAGILDGYSTCLETSIELFGARHESRTRDVEVECSSTTTPTLGQRTAMPCQNPSGQSWWRSNQPSGARLGRLLSRGQLVAHVCAG
jgi:short-subunit dehydrogenase involved in D-alanine esterification of teichoic acids